MDELRAVYWHEGKVRILDQTKLPEELVILEIADYYGVLDAIKSMAVRGAPAIGIAAAFGVVLSVWRADESNRAEFLTRVNRAMDELSAARPTAKNLTWAVNEMRNVLTRNLNRPLREIKQELLAAAQRILEDDVQRCKQIGENGARLLPVRAGVLTHCNAGLLATGGYGTALGIVRAAVAGGRKVHVYVDETRPLLQGARLTAFELMDEGINVTLITDNTAAYVMKRGLVDVVIVGADRIARNGDMANKIGTYGLALLAKAHRIPFVVAAPLSTFDPEAADGDSIPIEERDPDEVRKIGDRYIAPPDVPVFNPAFDVTPHTLISAIVTEKGVIKFPDESKLLEWLK